MQKRLTRSTTDRMIAGVCGGLGQYLGIDPTLIRLAFAGLFLLGFGSPALLYLLLWVIVPREDAVDAAPTETVRENVQEMKTRTQELVSGVKDKMNV